MSRQRELGRVNGWPVIDSGDVDGIVHFDGQTVRLTARTWRALPGKTALLLDAMHAYAADPTCDQVVLNEAVYRASLQLANHRAQFKALRRRLRSPDADLAPVVALRSQAPSPATRSPRGRRGSVTSNSPTVIDPA
jgi:hypothetical protein